MKKSELVNFITELIVDEKEDILAALNKNNKEELSSVVYEYLENCDTE